MVYTKLIIDQRHKNLSKVYPIKLRVTCNGIQKYYLTGYKIGETDFPELMKDVPPKRLKDLRMQIDSIELKARTIISKLNAFSFLLFEGMFYESKKNSKSIFGLYQTVIDEKLGQGKIGTAFNYRASMKSLMLFAPKLAYVDVTPKFLKEYEKYLLQNGKSISTVGIYLRPLRAILNEAISNNYLNREHYPFGPKKYIIPESRNIKKALAREDLKKIVDYVPDSKNIFECRAKDFWLLSYLCQGINPKDILLLKKKDVEGDFIKFIRQKTKDTTRANLMEIIVPLLPEAKQIINRWQCTNENSPYLFNFINNDMSAMEQHKTIQQFVLITNKYMKRISQSLGIQKKCTCYSARYGFTQAMIEADVSIEYIRQCLGHQSPTTTLRYISSFESSKRMEIASKYLLKF